MIEELNESNVYVKTSELIKKIGLTEGNLIERLANLIK